MLWEQRRDQEGHLAGESLIEEVTADLRPEGQMGIILPKSRLQGEEKGIPGF